MKPFQRKTRIILSALFTATVIIFLAGGIDSVEFSKGYLTGGEERETTGVGKPGAPTGRDPGFFSKLFIFLLPTALITLILSLIFKESRRRVIIVMILGFLFLFLFSLLWEPTEPEKTVSEEAPPMTMSGPARMFGSGDRKAAPTKDGLDTSPSPWLVFIITLCIIAGAAGGGFLLWRRLSSERGGPTEDIGEEIQQSLTKVRRKEDVKNTVIRCYLKMTRIVKEELGLTRKEAMTPREFGLHLEDKGMKREDIHTLTILFEQVRYGARADDEALSAEAASCLSSIARDLENTRRGEKQREV